MRGAKKRGRRGNSLIEAALFIPFLVTLLVSLEQIGKLTYTYYTLKKTLFAAARYIGTQQGVNVCDSGDANVVAGINFALTGTTDGTGAAFISDLTPDMLSVSGETYDPVGQVSSSYDCSLAGTIAPDSIVVSLPNGYTITPIIPFLTQMPILFKPQVKVPYGGT